MSIIELYVTHWRFVVLILGGVLLALAALTGVDFGVFPYVFILLSSLAVNQKNRMVADRISKTIVQPSKMSRFSKRPVCFVLVTFSLTVLAAGLVLFGVSALQILRVFGSSLDTNISLLLMLLSTVMMFFLESVAIRYGWFESDR